MPDLSRLGDLWTRAPPDIIMYDPVQTGQDNPKATWLELSDTDPSPTNGLEDKLQILTSDLRAEESSRTNTEKRVLDAEHRIQGMFAQLNRMDQDTITNNQLLAHRLTEMEQTFNNHVAKEVNNLADHTADVLRKSEEEEGEYMTGLTEDMYKMEGSIQSQAAELERMKVTLEEERTNEKPMLRNKLEDLQSQVEELNTRFKQD